MGVTPGLHGQARGLAVVVLPQPDAGLPGQRHQGATRFLVEPAVGRVRDGLLHHRGVHRDLGQTARRHRAGGTAGLDGLGQQPLHSLLADAAAPAAERGRMNGRPVLEDRLAGEVLEVRVLDPAGEDGLIGETVGVLQIHQPGHQARMRGGASLGRRKEACPLPLEPGPVDQGREPNQLVTCVNHVDQARAPRVGRFSRARTVLHARQNCRVGPGFPPDPAICRSNLDRLPQRSQ
jgi:hypothetical protein